MIDSLLLDSLILAFRISGGSPSTSNVSDQYLINIYYKSQTGKQVANSNVNTSFRM